MKKLWKQFERKFSGHWNLGKRVTIYGANAMHWAVNIYTRRWGYICFRLPLPCFGYWWSMYFYCSPNGTPWAATFYRSSNGRGSEVEEKKMADVRRARFGHNFDTRTNRHQLGVINGYWSEEGPCDEEGCCQ